MRWYGGGEESFDDRWMTLAMPPPRTRDRRRVMYVVAAERLGNPCCRTALGEWEFAFSILGFGVVMVQHSVC